MLTPAQILPTAYSVILFLLMLLVYLRRKESGFLFLLIGQAVTIGIFLLAVFFIGQVTRAVFLLLGYLPAALGLAGWILLACKKSGKNG